MKIEISTNVASPALAKKIKTDLSQQYPPEFSFYLKYLKNIREAVKTKIPEEAQRKDILHKIVNDPHLVEQCQDSDFCQEIDNLNFFREVEKWY